MCFGGDDASKAIQQQEAQRAGLIQQGVGNINRAFSGFDQNFYNRQRNAVLAAQLPQVGDQFRQQRNQLGYNLAGQGLLRSSAGAGLASALTKELSQQQQNVSNQATQAVQGLQGQIGAQKGQLLSQLQQSADPTLAGQRALESATQFSAPSLVQPLGNLFQNWANIYLAGQVGKIYGQQQQQNQQLAQILSATGNKSSYTVGSK